MQTWSAMFELSATRPSVRQSIFTHLAKALVLTHESAPQELWEPYLGHLLRPLRPMVLFGRDASLQPRCPREAAVYYGWKDTGDRNLEFPVLAKWASTWSSEVCFPSFVRLSSLPSKMDSGCGSSLAVRVLLAFCGVSPRWTRVLSVLFRCTESLWRFAQMGVVSPPMPV